MSLLFTSMMGKLSRSGLGAVGKSENYGKNDFMNYIILDMEWNQALSNAQMVRSPVMLYGEIIQIGAIKVNSRFEYLDKIKINVRPQYYKIMNPHVEKITGISGAQLKTGETFQTAFKRFSEWCADGNEFRFITWGFDDLGILADNLALYGLDTSFGADYINLQLIYNRQIKSEHLQCALSTAAESLGIPLDVQVHDAFNDAFLTYEVCKKLDMALGIAEYAQYAATISKPVYKDAIEGISDPKKMLNDPRVTAIECPRCGARLDFRDWIFGGKGCRSIAKCGDCGKYLIKLKTVKITEGDYTVLRTLYDADEEDERSFAAKLKKREERLAKIKARREAQNDNNDNA